MSEKVTPIFAANWKMNKLLHEVEPYMLALKNSLEEFKNADSFKVLVFPPAIYLDRLSRYQVPDRLELGIQQVGVADEGAFTGEISPKQVISLGVGWTLVGHSERRHLFHETENHLKARLIASLENKLKIIYCVGETLEQRQNAQTQNVIRQQMEILSFLNPSDFLNGRRVVIAYEPVWAIGTGKTATERDVEDAHQLIRNLISKKMGLLDTQIKVIYGGSVREENASRLMAQPSVDGLLVGGSSLDVYQFFNIIKNGLLEREVRQ